MASCEVGDDVFRDDPTILALEKEVAALMGKEEGLLLPSGTMSNLCAVCTWLPERGSEFIIGHAAHIHIYEQGGTATLGGCHPRVVRNLADGTMDLAEVNACFRGSDDHYASIKLICIEQTHNKCGGIPISLEFTDAIGALAKEQGVALHIDGARVFNAAAALGVEPARLVAAADSVSVCLSKGLGAPVGSVLVGPAAFIRSARRLRKALGGGMRQAGVLAAAGLVAIREVRLLLPADHANMARLAAGLATVPGVALRGGLVPPTNICFIDLAPQLDAVTLQSGLRARGILANVAAGGMRVVTHHQVSAEAVDDIVAAFHAICTPLMSCG